MRNLRNERYAYIGIVTLKVPLIDVRYVELFGICHVHTQSKRIYTCLLFCNVDVFLTLMSS